MKKKEYTKPRTQTFNLRGPVVMLEVSNSVNGYEKEADTFIGDGDD